MNLQRTRTHASQNSTSPAADDPLESGAGPGNLQQQAAAFAQIAREAREACQQGADAERTLEARRNRSGQ